MDINDLVYWLPSWMKHRRFNASTLAEASGLGQTAIYDILNGKSKRPRYETLLAIARTLDCTVEALYADPWGLDINDKVAPPDAPPLTIRPGGNADTTRAIVAGAYDLPILGEARAGYQGIFMGNGEPKAWIQRPPPLIGVIGAFAVYVRGTSMENRYFDGELLYVDPSKPVRKIDFVLIETFNQEAFVKQFMSRDNDFVKVAQFNPVSTIEFAVPTVKNVFRVVGTADER